MTRTAIIYDLYSLFLPQNLCSILKVPLIIKLISFSLSIFLSQTTQAEIPAKMIAYGCYSCHGSALSDIAQARPLSSHTLHTTLMAFKYNKRTATVMNRITKGYSDQELKAVSIYLSTLD